MRYLFLHAWKGTLVLLVLVTDVQAQVRKDYIVTLAGDTIPFKTHFIRNSWKLFGNKNGRDTMYRAKDLRAFNAEEIDYEALHIKKKKKFYKVVISDELSLYTRYFHQTAVSLRPIGSEMKRPDVITAVPYVRKKTHPPGEVYEIYGLTWRKKFRRVIGNCPEVIVHLEEKGSYTQEERIPEYVKLYNERCAPKN